jgi:hypothetical protein
MNARLNYPSVRDLARLSRGSLIRAVAFGEFPASKGGDRLSLERPPRLVWINYLTGARSQRLWPEGALAARIRGPRTRDQAACGSKALRRRARGKHVEHVVLHTKVCPAVSSDQATANKGLPLPPLAIVPACRARVAGVTRQRVIPTWQICSLAGSTSRRADALPAQSGRARCVGPTCPSNTEDSCSRTATLRCALPQLSATGLATRMDAKGECDRVDTDGSMVSRSAPPIELMTAEN